MSQDSESRFAHLLKPLKDLAKNWNIDIAQNLEDYLSELEDIQFTYDNGQANMDFAEAALLIQGSACIYSKKVEFLYNLVMELYTILLNKKRQENEKRAGERGGGKRNNEDADDYEDILEDLTHKFSLGKNIDMKEDSKNLESALKFLVSVPMGLMKADIPEHRIKIYNDKNEHIGYKDEFVMNSFIDSSTGMLHFNPEYSDNHIYFTGRDISERQEIDIPENNQAPSPMPCDDLPIDTTPPASPITSKVDLGIKNEVEEEKDGLRSKKVAKLAEAKVEMWIPFDPHESVPPDKLMSCSKRIRKLPKKLNDGMGRKRPRPADSKCESTAEFQRKLQSYVEETGPGGCRKADTATTEEGIKELKLRNRIIKTRLDKENRAPPVDECEEEVCDVAVADNDSDYLPGDVPDTSPGPLGDNVPFDYQNLVKTHVQAVIAAGQEFVQSTELRRKVAEWEKFVLPKLGEAEKRETFNALKNTDAIIASLDGHGDTVCFSSLVKGKPATDISRTFLASLMLANSGNVALMSPTTANLPEMCLQKDIPLNQLSLKLLSTKKRHDEIKEYMATEKPNKSDNKRSKRPSSDSEPSTSSNSSKLGYNRRKRQRSGSPIEL